MASWAEIRAEVLVKLVESMQKCYDVLQKKSAKIHYLFLRWCGVEAKCDLVLGTPTPFKIDLPLRRSKSRAIAKHHPPPLFWTRRASFILYIFKFAL